MSTLPLKILQEELNPLGCDMQIGPETSGANRPRNKRYVACCIYMGPNFAVRTFACLITANPSSIGAVRFPG